MLTGWDLLYLMWRVGTLIVMYLLGFFIAGTSLLNHTLASFTGGILLSLGAHAVIYDPRFYVVAIFLDVYGTAIQMWRDVCRASYRIGSANIRYSNTLREKEKVLVKLIARKTLHKPVGNYEAIENSMCYGLTETRTSDLRLVSKAVD